MNKKTYHTPEPINLDTSYGQREEFAYLKNTIKKIPWYLEQGYPLASIRLPEGISTDSDDADILQALQEQYRSSDYEFCAEALRQEWVDVSRNFIAMAQEPQFVIKSVYRVVLTKYGTGGNYNTKLGKVTIRIDGKSAKKMAGIVAHEIVHMAIQHLIEKHNVRHWRKERLVDLLVENYFPGLKKMQNIKEDVSVVDRTFAESFPDMEAITRSVGNGGGIN